MKLTAKNNFFILLLLVSNLSFSEKLNFEGEFKGEINYAESMGGFATEARQLEIVAYKIIQKDAEIKYYNLMLDKVNAKLEGVIKKAEDDKLDEALKEFKNIWENGTNKDIHIELSFCILTPQSKALNAWQAITNLKKDDLIYTGKAEELVEFLNIVRFKKYSKRIFIFAFFVGFLVYSPLGINIYNARRWIGVGGFTFMPSDFMKIASIMLMAYIIDKYKNKFTFKNVFFKYLAIVGLASFSVMIQPDLSNTLIIIGTLTAMYIIAGMDKKAILFSGMGISIASFAAVYFLNSGYSRTSRIQAFINPLKYRDSKSWQLIKSLFAITNGSLWGVGLGNGRQKYTLSEAHNDFIFATIAEEFGFIGSVFLIGVYIYLAYLGIMISRYIKNLYGKMIVLGITFSIGLQTLVNIGTATGTIPPTGVTLPFVSYGGSSLVMTSIMIGIILGIVRYDIKGR